MAKSEYIVGLDIGNSFVKTVVLEVRPEINRPQVVGVGVAPSSGMRRGAVADMEEVVKDIKTSISQAQQNSNFKITKAYVGINGPHIRTQTSRGIIAVSRADNEISQEDVQRVIEAASAINIPPNREIIHIIPKTFIIDGQEYVKNPVGMSGVRLEADVLIIDALSPFVRSLVKAVNSNDIEVSELVFSPLAASKAVLDKKSKEHGVLSLDVGGGLCGMAIFEEGDLIHTAVLPLGSQHITKDLAIVLRTELDTAEQVKLEHGFIKNSNGSKTPVAERSSLRGKEQIDLSDLTGENNFLISKKQIGEVISARVYEILDIVSRELKKVNKHSLLPAGVSLIGGGAKLPGFLEYAKSELRLPVRLAGPKDLDGIVNRVDDPTFATAVGLALWGIEREVKSGSQGGGLVSLGSNQAVKNIKRWFKNFIP